MDSWCNDHATFVYVRKLTSLRYSQGGLEHARPPVNNSSRVRITIDTLGCDQKKKTSGHEFELLNNWKLNIERFEHRASNIEYWTLNMLEICPDRGVLADSRRTDVDVLFLHFRVWQMCHSLRHVWTWESAAKRRPDSVCSLRNTVLCKCGKSLQYSCCSPSYTPIGHSTLPFLSFCLTFVQTQPFVASPPLAISDSESLRWWVVRIPTFLGARMMPSLVHSGPKTGTLLICPMKMSS